MFPKYVCVKCALSARNGSWYGRLGKPRYTIGKYDARSSSLVLECDVIGGTPRVADSWQSARAWDAHSNLHEGGGSGGRYGTFH